MSTPATFQFLNEAPFPTQTTVFLDMDGYPEGAANYYRAMLKADAGTRPMDFLMAFVRENKFAYLLASPEIWTNTLFRYTLKHLRLTAERRIEARKDQWETIFDGDLLDFVNSQPGPMVHRVALFAGCQPGYYTTADLNGHISQALTRQTAAANEVDQPNLEKAAQRVKDLKAIAVAAYQAEEAAQVPA